MNKTIIFGIFDTYAASVQHARKVMVDALRKAGVTTYEQARPLAMEWAAKKTGCSLVEGRGKAQGTMVLDRTHDGYESARKTVQRVCEAFTKPEAPSERKEVDVVAALLKRYESLTPAQKRAFKASI